MTVEFFLQCSSLRNTHVIFEKRDVYAFLKGGLCGVVWVIFIIVIILLILAFLSPVKLSLYFRRIGEHDHIAFTLRMFGGLIHYHTEIPWIQFLSLSKGLSVKQETSDAVNPENTELMNLKLSHFTYMAEHFHWLLTQTSDLFSWLRKTLRHITCYQLQWKTAIGIDDAAHTAQIVGGAWAVKSMLIQTLFKYIKRKTVPSLSIEPIYHQYRFATVFKANFKISVWSILYAILQLILRFRNKRSLLSKLIPHRSDDNSSRFGEAYD